MTSKASLSTIPCPTTLGLLGSMSTVMRIEEEKARLGDKKSKGKHALSSKFTSNGTSRFQPKSGSEGMLLYEKCRIGMLSS